MIKKEYLIIIKIKNFYKKMSEDKKGIKQIGPHSFLFCNNPYVYYFLSFEIIDPLNVQIYLIKIMPTETYVFEVIIPFNKFGTDYSSSHEAIQNILLLIRNFDFTIKEESNKILLTINSKEKASIELLISNRDKKAIKKSIYKGKINNLQNKIAELLSTIVKQESKINELRKKEDDNRIILNKLGRITNSIALKLDKPNNINNKYNHERNSLKLNNFQNQNNDIKNNKLYLTKSMTMQNFNPFLKDINLYHDNINKNKVIKK